MEGGVNESVTVLVLGIGKSVTEWEWVQKHR